MIIYPITSIYTMMSIYTIMSIYSIMGTSSIMSIYIIRAGTLGCVFIDNEMHESGVTKCTTGEA